MPFQHNKINVKLRCHNLLPEPRCRSPETLALLGPHVRLGPPRLQSIGGVEQPRDAAHVALAPLDDAAVRVVAGHEGAHPWVEGDDALWYTCKEEQKKKKDIGIRRKTLSCIPPGSRSVVGTGCGCSGRGMAKK